MQYTCQIMLADNADYDDYYNSSLFFVSFL